MLKKFKESLIKLGITDKEAGVYLVLLNEGSATADKISKLAGLNRSTTYVQIETLTKIGLVSSYKKGKKTFFAAESPMNLSRVIEAKSRTLENQKTEAALLVPELMKVFSTTGERPVIRTFEGKEGLTTMRNEMLDFKGNEMFIAFATDELYRIFTKEELMEFSNKRAKKNITSYVLYNKEGEDMTSVPPQELRRLSKDEFPFSSDIYIYDNTVSMATTSGNIFAITIENKDVADTMRSLFQLAWQRAEAIPYKR